MNTPTEMQTKNKKAVLKLLQKSTFQHLGQHRTACTAQGSP